MANRHPEPDCTIKRVSERPNIRLRAPAQGQASMPLMRSNRPGTKARESEQKMPKSVAHTFSSAPHALVSVRLDFISGIGSRP